MIFLDAYCIVWPLWVSWHRSNMASDLLPWLPIVSSMPSPSFQIKLPSAIPFTSSNPSIFSSILLWNSYWYTNATLTHFFHFIRLRGVLKFLSKELSVSNAKMQSWYQLKRILYHCQFLWADDQQLKLGTQVVWKCVQWYAVYAQSNFILSKRFVYKCKSTYLFGGLSHSLSYTLLLEVFYFSNKVVIYRNRSLWWSFTLQGEWCCHFTSSKRDIWFSWLYYSNISAERFQSV